MAIITSGKYTVPPEYQSLKPEGISTTLKSIGGHVYVYTLKKVPDQKHPGRTKSTSDTCIGKIEGGKFIPNSRYIPADGKDQPPKPMSMFDGTSRDYGEYAVALACSEDILERLETVFTIEESRQIYAAGIIFFVNGHVPASYIKDVFDQSILSTKWPTLPLSENSFHTLLKLLGLHNVRTELFQQALIDESSGLTALDGHVIQSCSNLSDMADYGNKYYKYGNKQLNVMMAFDVENNSPLTCKAFDGAVPDKVEVQEWFETYHFNPGTTFIADMGFYSEKNIGLFRSNESYFIVPVPDNTVIAKMMKQSISFTGSFQYAKTDESGNPTTDTVLYRETTVAALEEMAQKQENEKVEQDFRQRMEEYERDPDKDKRRMPRIHKAKQISRSDYPNDRVIMCRNETMHYKLAAEYYSQIGQDDKHTEEKFRELEPLFGVIVFRLNSDDTPEHEYVKYKKRWRIETNYNHIRNDVDFNDLQLEDYYTTQGMSFIMLIEDMVYHHFMKTLRVAPSAFVSHMSKKECLQKAAHAKVMSNSDGVWHGSMVTTKVTTLLQELGVDWEGDLDKLNRKLY